MIRSKERGKKILELESRLCNKEILFIKTIYLSNIEDPSCILYRDIPNKTSLNNFDRQLRGL